MEKAIEAYQLCCTNRFSTTLLCRSANRSHVCVTAVTSERPALSNLYYILKSKAHESRQDKILVSSVRFNSEVTQG